uniref:Uncharacterized protein n=1 Tax=Cacopsylla melanoneura TaxID=428564 RepID=A0A8D8TSY0_9HEMI
MLCCWKRNVECRLEMLPELLLHYRETYWVIALMSMDSTVRNVCPYPYCSASPHAMHLFNCPANPTDHTLIDLWNRTKLVSSFMGLNDFEDPGQGKSNAVKSRY